MIFVVSGKCLFLSGLVPRPMNAENDKELLSFGIGFTNIVERTTRANQELTRQEIEEGETKIFRVNQIKIFDSTTHNLSSEIK